MAASRTPAQILAEWRSALASLARIPAGSAEEAAVQGAIDALRDEYHDRVDAVMRDARAADAEEPREADAAELRYAGDATPGEQARSDGRPAVGCLSGGADTGNRRPRGSGSPDHARRGA